MSFLQSKSITQYHWHTCPTEIREQIGRLLSGILALLPDKVAGIYLHGSLAMGCFNPQRSDLDLLVITHTTTPDAVKTGLAHMLLNHSLDPAPIEIHFIQRSKLNPWQYPTLFDFHYSESWRKRFTEALQRDGSWQIFTDPNQADEDLGAHVTVTRRRGIRLYGDSISAVLPDVPTKDYIDSILLDVLSDEYGLASALNNPTTIILNACRSLAYLKNGEILSKDEGGEWALWNLPEEYHAVVLKALCEYRSSNKSYIHTKASLQQFATFMREQINQMGHLRPLGEPPVLNPAFPASSYFTEE